MRSFIIAAALLASVTTAKADAIYQWVSNPGTSASGTLHLSDASYLAGGVSGVEAPYAGVLYFGPDASHKAPATAPPVTIDWSLHVTGSGAAATFFIEQPFTGLDPLHLLTFSLTVVGDGLAGFLRHGDC